MPSDYKSLGDKQAADPNIMKVKDVNKVRPLDNVVAGWKQHAIQHPSDPEQFQSITCPGARSCPLCRKPVNDRGEPHFQISRRFAANVWDYDTASVKVLIAGPQVYDIFKQAALVGIDPSSCDWTITRTGKGKQTDYNVIRHDASPFTAAHITPDMLHSVDKYEQPDNTEKIFDILEKFGIDYDSLTIPSYTYEQALAFVMPYTKHKGLTIEQLLQNEPQYAEWMHSTKLEQGQLGDPVFVALQTAMEERGLVPSLDSALAMIPDPTPTPTSTPTPTEPSTISSSSSNMVKLVKGDQEVMVPSVAVDAMIAAGYKRWEPSTPADANTPMRVLIGGNEVELPREQALMLIDAGTATKVEAKPEPKLPLPDELVQVDIAGTVVPMPYVQAAVVVDNPASNAKFVDPGVTQTHNRIKEKLDEGIQAQVAETIAEQPVTAPAYNEQAGVVVDPEKPFVCNECGAAYKVQGALTQHINREHKSAEPQPTAIPSAGGDLALRDRVKDKIAHAPFARDFARMLEIFKESTNKTNFTDMDDEDLVKLEERIDLEVTLASLDNV